MPCLPLTSLEFHSSFGPSLGQALSRPVSVETASRLGPRHCGQSLEAAGSAVRPAYAARARAANETTTRLRMRGSPREGHLGYRRAGARLYEHQAGGYTRSAGQSLSDGV